MWCWLSGIAPSTLATVILFGHFHHSKKDFKKRKIIWWKKTKFLWFWTVWHELTGFDLFTVVWLWFMLKTGYHTKYQISYENSQIGSFATVASMDGVIQDHHHCLSVLIFFPSYLQQDSPISFHCLWLFFY